VIRVSPRLLRFCVVGATNATLTLATFTVLTQAGASAPPASAVAFGLGAVNGYVLNRRWTFAGARGGPGTVARYVAVQLLGALLSAAGVALATTDLELARVAAEVVVLPAVAIITYILSSRVVFVRVGPT